MWLRVWLRGAAGTGKTWACTQLVHALATACAQRASEPLAGLPLVPVFVHVQGLTRLLHDWPLRKALDNRMLLQYLSQVVYAQTADRTRKPLPTATRTRHAAAR